MINKIKANLEEKEEIRKEVQNTGGKYLVSNLGNAIGPLGKLNSKIDKDGNLKIKNTNGFVQITVTYNNGKQKETHKSNRICQYVHLLIAELFTNEIENSNIKDSFTNPKITHKDGNSKNNAANNLKRIDLIPAENRTEGEGTGKLNYQEEHKTIIEKLIKDPTVGNKELAKIVFGDQYIDTGSNNNQHDQVVYRARKNLEYQNLIPVSQAKKANKKSGKAKQEIINLIKEKELSGKEIAEKYGVTPTTVSRIKKRREQQEMNKS